MLLALAGCSTNDTFTRMGFPNPVTEQGKITLSLWQGSWIAGLLVGAVVWGMIVWAVIFHRKRGDKLPPQVRYNMPIEILYTVVPFVLIAVLFYYTAKDENTIDAIPAHPAGDGQRDRLPVVLGVQLPAVRGQYRRGHVEPATRRRPERERPAPA